MMKRTKKSNELVGIASVIFIVAIVISVLFRQLWFLLLFASVLLLISGIALLFDIGGLAQDMHERNRRERRKSPGLAYWGHSGRGKLEWQNFGILFILGGILFAGGALAWSQIPELERLGVTMGVIAALCGFVWLILVIILQR